MHRLLGAIGRSVWARPTGHPEDVTIVGWGFPKWSEVFRASMPDTVGRKIRRQSRARPHNVP